MSQDNTRFEGGIGTLGTIADSVDEYEAASRWWARAVLLSNFKGGANDPANILTRMGSAWIPLEPTSAVLLHIGGFAAALSHISREQEVREIQPGGMYVPVMRDAVELCGLDPTTNFPPQTYTRIADDDTVRAVLHGGEAQDIWRPEGRYRSHLSIVSSD